MGLVHIPHTFWVILKKVNIMDRSILPRISIKFDSMFLFYFFNIFFSILKLNVNAESLSYAV